MLSREGRTGGRRATKKEGAQSGRRYSQPSGRLLEDDGKPLRVIAWKTPITFEITVHPGKKGLDYVSKKEIGTDRKNPTVIAAGEKENFVRGLLRRMPEGIAPFDRRDVLLAADLLEVDESGHVVPPTPVEVARERKLRLFESIERRARDVRPAGVAWRFLDRGSPPPEELADYLSKKSYLLQKAADEVLSRAARLERARRLEKLDRREPSDRLVLDLDAMRAKVKRELKRLGGSPTRRGRTGRPRKLWLDVASVRAEIDQLTEWIRASRVTRDVVARDLGLEDVEGLGDRRLALMHYAQGMGIPDGTVPTGRRALLRAAHALAQLLAP